MKVPTDSALHEILNNHFFKNQWLKEIARSEDLSNIYKGCIIGKSDIFIPGTKITYFEFIEVHARCCVDYYRICFPGDHDRQNYRPKLRTDSRVEKPSKQRRRSRRPSDRNRSKKRLNKSNQSVDNNTIDLLVS